MLKKEYLEDGSVCRVTFVLPSALVANTAHVVGDFNDWEEEATPMAQTDDGLWRITVSLKAGSEYQYRFLVNGEEWHNDWEADKYFPNPFGGENSVVVT
jgi:1,4-alpha-glucan branching enzyme